MGTTLAALITSCRALAGDGLSDNFKRTENVNDTEYGYAIDGANRTFVVKNLPVVPGGFFRVVVDNAVTVAFVPTEAQGQLVFTAAPTASCFVSYYYYLFSDTIWTEFISLALEALNFEDQAGDTTDATLVPYGLLMALKLYAVSFFCRRVAMQTGIWYNQKLQERVDDRDNISAKFVKLAESNMKAAQAAVLSFYSGSGTDTAPAFRVGGYQPRPWTPAQ